MGTPTLPGKPGLASCWQGSLPTWQASLPSDFAASTAQITIFAAPHPHPLAGALPTACTRCARACLHASGRLHADALYACCLDCAQALELVPLALSRIGHGRGWCLFATAIRWAPCLARPSHPCCASCAPPPIPPLGSCACVVLRWCAPSSEDSERVAPPRDPGCDVLKVCPNFVAAVPTLRAVLPECPRSPLLAPGCSLLTPVSVCHVRL